MIGVLLVAVVATYLAACLIAGYGRPPSLDGFSADSDPLVRHFASSPSAVAAAFRVAAQTTAGMRLAEERRGVMLVDSRPTSRVLGGNFGMAIRIRFVEDDADRTEVTAEAMNKVRFALSVNHEAAFVHAERALRMAAKRSGLRELLPEVDGIGGRDATP
jgi:hypothetical protein